MLTREQLRELIDMAVQRRGVHAINLKYSEPNTPAQAEYQQLLTDADALVTELRLQYSNLKVLDSLAPTPGTKLCITCGDVPGPGSLAHGECASCAGYRNRTGQPRPWMSLGIKLHDREQERLRLLLNAKNRKEAIEMVRGTCNKQ